MSSDRIARLTDSQRAYLRLVLAHRSSKEIAQEFDISAHTVDKRIKEAMRILGVGSRIEAARILASIEEEGNGRRLGPQASDLAPARDSAPDWPDGTERVAKGDDRDGRSDDVEREPARRGRGIGALPYPLFGGARRNLSRWQRAGWMIGLIIGLAMATGILLSGLIALSTLFNSVTR